MKGDMPVWTPGKKHCTVRIKLFLCTDDIFPLSLKVVEVCG